MALAGDRPAALQRLDGPGARAGGEYNGPAGGGHGYKAEEGNEIQRC
jgi:hypothetical protein